MEKLFDSMKILSVKQSVYCGRHELTFDVVFPSMGHYEIRDLFATHYKDNPQTEHILCSDPIKNVNAKLVVATKHDNTYKATANIFVMFSNEGGDYPQFCLYPAENDIADIDALVTRCCDMSLQELFGFLYAKAESQIDMPYNDFRAILAGIEKAYDREDLEFDEIKTAMDNAFGKETDRVRTGTLYEFIKWGAKELGLTLTEFVENAARGIATSRAVVRAQEEKNLAFRTILERHGVTFKG